jgi:branched-chain amino acid transport system permease protein
MRAQLTSRAGGFLRFLWTVGPLAALVVVAAEVASTGGAFLHESVVTDLIELLFVISLYIFVGNSGIFSFGHVAFASIGAYAAGIFAIPVATKAELFSSMPPELAHRHAGALGATLIGGGVAATVGFLVSIPVMRLSGLAASLATFSLLIIVHVVAQNLNQVTNGQSAMTGVPQTTSRYDVIVWCFIAMVAAYAFQQSRWGLRLRASREDEVAARASGVGVYWERRIAWTLSTFFMGIAGGLYGQFLGTFSPDAFYLYISFLIVAMLVVGGTTSLAGAVIGSVFISAASELLRRVENGPDIGPVHIPVRPGVQAVGLALIMLLVLIFRPRGLTQGRELHLPVRWRAGRDSEPIPTGLGPASPGVTPASAQTDVVIK